MKEGILVKNHILTLERQLMRRSRHDMEQLLADDFYEIGTSGKIYTKQIELDALTNEALANELPEVLNFRIHELSDTLIQAIYDTVEFSGRRSHRSSLWRKTDDAWQLFFHQGTKF